MSNVIITTKPKTESFLVIILKLVVFNNETTIKNWNEVDFIPRLFNSAQMLTKIAY